MKLRTLKNNLACIFCAVATLLAIIPLFFILFQILSTGFSSLNWEFFTEAYIPTDIAQGGLGHSIIGSFILLAIALLVGTPIGIFSAIYLSEYSRGRLAFLISLMNDILSGVPTIIIGVFVYSLIVLKFGFSAIAGGIALGIVMIPIITRSTEDLLLMVPREIREAGLALGISKSKVTMHLVFKTVISGVANGVILSIARILGETAPLLFTVVGQNWFETSIFKQVDAVSIRVYKYAGQPDAILESLAWGGAFFLIVVVLLLNILAKFMFKSPYEK